MKESKYYPWLDWVRFLAALMVLIVHSKHIFIGLYSELPSDQKTLPVTLMFAITRYGNEAVIVFFVLSGYLVAGKVLSRIWTSEFRVIDYTIDRLSRIYLPYIPALILSWICVVLIGIHPSIGSFICNALSLQGVFGETFVENGALWSIAYEVWFYVLAGSIGAFFEFKDRKLLPTMLAAWVLFISLAIFTILTSVFLFCWFVGGIAYFYRRGDRRIMWSSLLIAIIALMGMEASSGIQSFDSSVWARYLPPNAVFQLLFASSIAVWISQIVQYKPTSSVTQRIDRVGTTLASFSYTLYVTHCPILALSQHWLLPQRHEISYASLGSTLAGILICICAALGMYLLFERHTSRCKKLLRRLFMPKSAEPAKNGR